MQINRPAAAVWCLVPSSLSPRLPAGGLVFLHYKQRLLTSIVSL